MQKKYILILCLIIYYILTVLPHELVGESVAKTFSSFTRNTSNLIVSSIVLFIVTAAFYLLWPKVKVHEARKKLIVYMIITSILILLCFNILFVNNFEAVHFFQYAFFAMICFLITQNFMRTMVIGSIAAFFDELYQYIILTPETSNYYDFNDVVIDIVGIGMGLIICKTYNWPSKQLSIKHYLKVPEFWVVLFLVLFYFYGSSTDLISVLQNPEAPTPFTFLKYLPAQFWTSFPRQGIYYHILLPSSGLTIICLLWLLYFPLGKKNQ